MFSRSIRNLVAAGSIEDNPVLNIHSTEEGFCRAAQGREAFNDVI